MAPDQVALFDLGGTEQHDPGAAIGNDLDQSVSLQHAQRLPNWDVARLVLLGELPDHEPASRRECPGQDLLSNGVVDPERHGRHGKEYMI